MFSTTSLPFVSVFLLFSSTVFGRPAPEGWANWDTTLTSTSIWKPTATHGAPGTPTSWTSSTSTSSHTSTHSTSLSSAITSSHAVTSTPAPTTFSTATISPSSNGVTTILSIGVGINGTIPIGPITVAPTLGATVVVGASGPVATLISAINSELSCVVSDILNDFRLVTAVLVPDALTAATNTLEAILTATPTPSNIVEFAAELVEAGLTTQNVESAIDFVTGILEGEASSTNINLAVPDLPIYPYAGFADAPYDIPEAILRAAIYIPPTFKYGKGAQPIILVPGTGNIGYITFKGNLIPLLQGSTIADPVWLNIPGFLYNDAQQNAEFVAYAVNYIYSISGNKPIAVAGWSQGNIDTQWALKYWPSTRDRLSDHIAFSPDYHGTTLADFLGTPCEFLPPSILQQYYDSNYIKTLRLYDGDSAYVPTTTIYSGLLDEIVEPQQGTDASAFLLDKRNVGVTNTEVQSVCDPIQPAGSFYTHEGTLYNPIGFELLKDALAHAGPGQVSRISLDVCGDYLTPGLDLADFLETENSILVAAIALLTYPSTSNVEPLVKSYATNALAKAGF